MIARNNAEVLDMPDYLRMMEDFYGLKLPVIRQCGNATDTMQAMERNGVESLEIPACLRKQAY